MPKFIKNPVTIDAIQWTGYNRPEICEFMELAPSELQVDDLTMSLCIKTLEGYVARGGPSSWLIKGIEGEFYICHDRVFKKTYTEVKK